MKALLINGSPHEKGCTHRALLEVAGALEKEGFETEIAWIGDGPVRGCLACKACSADPGHCAFGDEDCVNALIEKCAAADALVVGSPVYFAGTNGALHAVLDRMFYAGNTLFRFKPAAGIASARRAGTTPTIDQINKFFQISCMPVASSVYWPMVHGSTPADVEQDEEGLQAMRMVGAELAWMARSFACAREAGIEPPTVEPKLRTNFIR